MRRERVLHPGRVPWARVDVDEAYHRVDAARRLMTVPGRRAEASGRLFFAKRLLLALKAGQADPDAILAEVLESLSSEAAREGARAEHRVAMRG